MSSKNKPNKETLEVFKELQIGKVTEFENLDEMFKQLQDAQPKAKRGFAAMSKEKQLEISRKGGAALKPEQRSYFKNRQLAIEAGRKGGSVKKSAKEQLSDG